MNIRGFKILLLVFFASACNKNDMSERFESIVLSTPEVEQTAERSAKIHYNISVEGNPTPQILEFGIIATTNAEAPFIENRIPSSNQDPFLQDFTLNLDSLEGEKNWYVRSYVLTSRDTILSEIATFYTGKYYQEGAGVVDVEGNFYKSVVLGSQEWMAENLRTRTFCEGDTLMVVSNSSMFLNPYTTPNFPFQVVSLYFDHQNDSLYGRFYTGNFATDGRNICPCGWRIPTAQDFYQLISFLGGGEYVGGKMKSQGILEDGSGLWRYPNILGNNLSGLNIHPAGLVWSNSFKEFQEESGILVLNNNEFLQNLPNQVVFNLSYINPRIQYWGFHAGYSFASIRCIKE